MQEEFLSLVNSFGSWWNIGLPPALPIRPYFVQCHLSPLSSNSDILMCRQVCQGLCLLRFPCGFHSRALLATCLSGLTSAFLSVGMFYGENTVKLQPFLGWVVKGEGLKTSYFKLFLDELKNVKEHTCDFHRFFYVVTVYVI